MADSDKTRRNWHRRGFDTANTSRLTPTKKSLNVYDTMRPLYRLSLFLGICPFTFPKNEYEKPKNSRKKLAYSVILLFLLTFNNNITTSMLNGRLPVTTLKRELIVLVIVALVYLNCIIGIIVLIVAILKRNELINFIIDIQEIDTRMMKNHMKIPYAKHRSAYYKTMFVLLLWLILHTALFFMNVILKVKSMKVPSTVDLASNLASTGNFFTAFITLLSICQLYFATYLMGVRFQLLNKKFRRIVHHHHVDIKMTIENLCDIHKKLCCICAAMNSIYSITMFFTILSTFSTTISYLYLFILQLRSDFTNYFNYMDILRYIMTIVINTIFQVTLLIKTTSLSEEV